MDLIAQPEAEQRLELAAVIQGEVSGKFDLTTGPLLRVKISGCRLVTHVVVWTAHHIICDGWSGALIVSELATIYSALKQGRLPETRSTAVLQGLCPREQKQSPETRQAIEYWRQQFAELPSLLDLPADRPRARIRSPVPLPFAGILNRHFISRSTGGRAKTVPRWSSCFWRLYKSLLYRLAGQTDLVIGMPAAGQAMTGNTSLVGHCVSLLPVRTASRRNRASINISRWSKKVY